MLNDSVGGGMRYIGSMLPMPGSICRSRLTARKGGLVSMGL